MKVLDFDNIHFEPGKLLFVVVRHEDINDTNSLSGKDILKSGEIVGRTEFILKS